MIDQPVFIFAAIPKERTRFKDFFADGPVKTLLEKPGELRYAGWDLQTLDQARIVKGEYLEVRNGDRKILDLYEDGTFLARALATDDFLGHGSPEKAIPNIRVNSLALIEFSYSFVRFYAQAIEFLEPKPTQVVFGITLENAKSDTPLYMLAYGVNSSEWSAPTKEYPAPEGSMKRQVDVSTSDLQSQPERIAYVLVEKVYTWFGLAPDKIPYVTSRDGNRMLDIAAIVKGGKS